MRLFIPFLASFLLVGCATEQPRELAGYSYKVLGPDDYRFGRIAGMMGCNNENTQIREYDRKAVLGSNWGGGYGSFMGLKCEGKDENFHDCLVVLNNMRPGSDPYTIDCLNSEGMVVRYSSL